MRDSVLSVNAQNARSNGLLGVQPKIEDPKIVVWIPIRYAKSLCERDVDEK